jgi:hypothetical protein
VDRVRPCFFRLGDLLPRPGEVRIEDGWWRANRRRLDAEALRDAILCLRRLNRAEGPAV